MNQFVYEPLTFLVDGIDSIFGLNKTTFVSILGLVIVHLKISFFWLCFNFSLNLAKSLFLLISISSMMEMKILQFKYCCFLAIAQTSRKQQFY